MPKQISIQPAGKSDLSSIKRLLEELFESVTDTEGLDMEQAIQNCRKLLKDPNHYMLIAQNEDKVIGFINFTTRNTLLHPAASGLIDELVVSHNYRGLGIGKRLIQATIKKCRELRCCEIEVSTEKSNTQARRFYKACGFEEDAVLLEKQL